MQAYSPVDTDHNHKVYNDSEELADLVRKIANQPSPPTSASDGAAEPPTKRIKLAHSGYEPDSSSHVHSVNLLQRHRSLTPPRDAPSISMAQNLHHLAISARRHASTHLQQVMIPSSVICLQQKDPAVLKATRYGTPSNAFRPDPYASDKAFGMFILAVDALQAGLCCQDISERERTVLGLDFGECAVEILRLCETRLLVRVDVGRLHDNAFDAVNTAVSQVETTTLILSSPLPADTITCGVNPNGLRSVLHN